MPVGSWVRLFDDLVEEEVEKFVGVLVLGGSKTLFEFFEFVDERGGHQVCIVGKSYKSSKWRSMALRRLNAGPALQAIERGEL